MSIYAYSHAQPLSSKHLPKSSGVYEVVCLPTGQRYIGSTSNFKTRVRMHRHRGRTQTHTPLFNKAWARWGEAAFTMRVLEETEDWVEREKQTIRDAVTAGEVLLNNLTYTIKPPKPKRVKKPAPPKKDWSHVIDIYTSTEPPKVLQERWGVSHACVSLIKSGRRGQKVLRLAGLI